MTLDLRAEPLRLNARHRVTADGLQWIVQSRRKGRDKWEGFAFGQTKGGLADCLSYEVYDIGGVEPAALAALESLPRHRGLAPGYDGPDIEAEIAKARAQERREALVWVRKTGGKQ